MATAVAADSAHPNTLNATQLQGLAVSQTSTARALLFGTPAGRDRARAVELLRNASDSHYGPAEFVLGAVLADNPSDAPKVREASDLLARAARDGCPGAAGLLGSMLFAANQKHPEISTITVKFLRAAAEGGDGMSQGLLGIAYQRSSLDLPKDLVTAYAWAHLARTAHPGEAQRLADIATRLEQEIAGELSPEERTRAQTQAAEFFKRYGHKSYPFCSQQGDANQPP
jgi:TPR repeat protein